MWFLSGVNHCPRDFSGGRLPRGTHPGALVAPLLERELGITAEFMTELQGINASALDVDSSLFSQKLWGYWVQISSGWKTEPTAHWVA